MPKLLEGRDSGVHQIRPRLGVALVRGPDGGPAILYSALGTARQMFPEWFGEPEFYASWPDGERLRPRDLVPVTGESAYEDRRALGPFLALATNSLAPDDEGHVRECFTLACRYGPLLSGLDAPNPEPLAEWWDWSRTLNGIRGVAERLHAGRKPRPSDWSVVTDGDIPADASERRQLLSDVLGRLLTMAQFPPARVSYGEGGLEVRILDPDLAPSALFAALVRWTLLTLDEETRGMWPCTECGAFHQRQRRPRVGGPAYCPRCRANKVPQRKYMERRRAGQSSTESP